MKSTQLGPAQNSRSIFQRILENLRIRLIFVIGFSLLYFGETYIRASEKTFWFDELCTLYICRLPAFHAAWDAVLHGADYDPPLFYLIQRADRALFGEGQVAMRLPAMVGFWILCLSLYRFVTKRAGPVVGWTAMVLPVLTGAYFYAYEARPHGIVLGLCGAALVCWDAAEESGRWESLWLTMFAGCLGAAFLTHCYAPVIVVPFGLVELVRTVRSKVIRPGRWIAFGIPAIVAAVYFIPLVRSFRANVAGTGFNDTFPAGFFQVPAFYVSLLAPCILVFLCALALFSFDAAGLSSRSSSKKEGSAITVSDALLTAGFLGIPVYGILIGKLGNGPFFARYFMTAVIGVCLVIGFAAKPRRSSNWPSVILALIVAGVLIFQSFAVVWHRLHWQGERLIEPSKALVMNTAIKNPLEKHALLVSNAGTSLPLAVAFQLDFLYLVHYWPSAVPRLYSVSGSTNELQYRLYSIIRRWCDIRYNPPETFGEFLRSHRDFLLYGNAECQSTISDLISKGVEIRSLRFGDSDHFLAAMHVKSVEETSAPRQ